MRGSRSKPRSAMGYVGVVGGGSLKMASEESLCGWVAF